MQTNTIVPLIIRKPSKLRKSIEIVVALSEKTKNDYRFILKDYIPASCMEIVNNWMTVKSVQLKIAKKRYTKLGDYRPPLKNQSHRISVNSDLNKYSFLITLVHEYAHLLVWDKYRNKVKSHGREWKKEYIEALEILINHDVFPSEIKEQLIISACKPRSATFYHTGLLRCLSIYDLQKDAVYIEMLPENSLFRSLNGKKFRKMSMLRKRFKCICLDNRKIYTFHPMATVLPVHE